MKKPAIGDDVLYRLPTRDTDSLSKFRPAKIVNGPWASDDGEIVNLTVFLDGLNDVNTPEKAELLRDLGEPGTYTLMHVSDARQGDEVGEWCWPSRPEEKRSLLARRARQAAQIAGAAAEAKKAGDLDVALQAEADRFAVPALEPSPLTSGVCQCCDKPKDDQEHVNLMVRGGGFKHLGCWEAECMALGMVKVEPTRNPITGRLSDTSPGKGVDAE